MELARIRDRVKSYIMENYLYTRPDFDLGMEDRLLGAGIIDSMGVIELLEFVQTEFEIAVQDDEITENNFGSVAAVADFVTRKRRQGQAA